MFKFRPGALVLALVALLALAPAAMAKGGISGGGGGGGGNCATIDSFDVTSGYTADGQPSITWSAVTSNLCLDEFAGSTTFDFSNSQDGLPAARSTPGSARAPSATRSSPLRA